VTAEKPTDNDETRPLEVPDDAAPVFVDSTGRRGRRIRFAFYGIGGLSLTYAGMVAMSLAGGPLNPETLLPFPDLLINRPAAVEATPEPAQPAPTGSNRPGDGRRTGQDGEAAQVPAQPGQSTAPVPGPPGPAVPEGTAAPSTPQSQAPSQPPSTAPSQNPAPSDTTPPATGTGGGAETPTGPGPENGSGGGTGTNTNTGSTTGGTGAGTDAGTGAGGSGGSGAGTGSTGGAGDPTGGTEPLAQTPVQPANAFAESTTTRPVGGQE
jgi:hypothetical protein